jgi:hypothetical protein
VNGRGGAYVPVVADRDQRLVFTLPRVAPGSLRPVLAVAPGNEPGAL